MILILHAFTSLFSFVAENMKLGLVYKNGIIINHRSFIKVIFNPILRFFGFEIGTVFKDGIVGKPIIQKTDRHKKIIWYSYGNNYDHIEKRRLII